MEIFSLALEVLMEVDPEQLGSQQVDQILTRYPMEDLVEMG